MYRACTVPQGTHSWACEVIARSTRRTANNRSVVHLPGHVKVTRPLLRAIDRMHALRPGTLRNTLEATYSEPTPGTTKEHQPPCKAQGCERQSIREGPAVRTHLQSHRSHCAAGLCSEHQGTERQKHCAHPGCSHRADIWGPARHFTSTD